MSADILGFPPRESLFPKRRPTGDTEMAGADAIVQTVIVEHRTRDDVQKDINAHIAARAAWARAEAWLAEADAQELPAGEIEEARAQAAVTFQELTWRGRHLLIAMPTDLKALVDLLMYLEKHYSILPQETCGKALGLDLLRTMRLSLRAIAKHGKHGPQC